MWTTISIILNVITIILVSLVFFISFLAFKQNPGVPFLQTFKKLWSSDKKINKTLTNTGPVYGDVGEFVGQDWATVDSILITEADTQDDLSSFVSEGRPNYVGTALIPTEEDKSMGSPPVILESPPQSPWVNWIQGID